MKFRLQIFSLALLFGASFAGAIRAQSNDGLSFERVKYNNPGLKVDAGVGLWAWPLPMDYDGDGDNDLVAASMFDSGRGVWFFENTEGNVKYPTFKAPVRLGDAPPRGNVSISYVGGAYHILTPGFRHPDFKTKALTAGVPVPYKKSFTASRADQWKLADLDGDGVTDLIVGADDWKDYGWDNAFNSSGEWVNGPLHGHVYFIKNGGTDESPKYGEAVQLKAGGKPLDVYGLPSPNLADWDGDGDLDIVCGDFLDKLTYFENTGGRTAPAFAKGRALTYQGVPIVMDLEVIVPTAIDWDKDGDVDLVVGQEDGRVALVENTGQRLSGMPAFLPPRFFQQQADEIKNGTLATPASYDWDGDGDEDIISGDAAGYISLIENLGGGARPKWAAPKYLEADDRVIRIQAGYNGSIQGPAEAKWGYTILSVADWNHDDLPDLVVNSIWGEVLWYENVGTRRRPRLRPAQAVEVEWPTVAPKPEWNWWNPKGKQLVTQWRTVPVVIDLNRDGLNDLVMLDQEGYLAFYERRKINGALKLMPGVRSFHGEGTSVFDSANKVAKGGDVSGVLRLNDGKAGKSGRRTFTFADWDRDGKLDLLVNSVNIDVMKNVGGGGKFVFRNQGTLAPAENLSTVHASCPTTVDWDRDKVPDLLVGAEDGFLYYLKSPHSKR